MRRAQRGAHRQPGRGPGRHRGAGLGSAAATGGQCLRNAGGEWRNLGEGLALDTCVQVLFSGRCVGPGDALYGRWNGQSVRLVQGGVEMSDGAGYRPLVSQDPQTCLLP